jgi:hypothetical protein
MLVKLSITEEWDINDDIFFSDDDPFFEENKDLYDTDTRVELMINRFVESIDDLVKYNRVIDAVQVEYIED